MTNSDIIRIFFFFFDAFGLLDVSVSWLIVSENFAAWYHFFHFPWHPWVKNVKLLAIDGSRPSYPHHSIRVAPVLQRNPREHIPKHSFMRSQYVIDSSDMALFFSRRHVFHAILINWLFCKHQFFDRHCAKKIKHNSTFKQIILCYKKHKYTKSYNTAEFMLECIIYEI